MSMANYYLRISNILSSVINFFREWHEKWSYRVSSNGLKYQNILISETIITNDHIHPNFGKTFGRDVIRRRISDRQCFFIHLIFYFFNTFRKIPIWFFLIVIKFVQCDCVQGIPWASPIFEWESGKLYFPNGEGSVFSVLVFGKRPHKAEMRHKYQKTFSENKSGFWRCWIQICLLSASTQYVLLALIMFIPKQNNSGTNIIASLTSFRISQK